MVGMSLYIINERQKFSVNTMLMDQTGLCYANNNWTFDLISEELLLSIVDQMINNHNYIDIIYLSMSGLKTDLTAQFLYEVSQKNRIQVLFENNINAAAYGYINNRPYKELQDIIIGINLPINNLPEAGIIINNAIFKGKYDSAGELKNLIPNIDWVSLSYKNKKYRNRVIKELFMGVSDLISPDKIICYSEYVDKTSIKDLSKLLDVDIQLKSSFKQDLTHGMTFLLFKALDTYSITEHA